MMSFCFLEFYCCYIFFLKRDQQILNNKNTVISHIFNSCLFYPLTSIQNIIQSRTTGNAEI